MLYLLRLPRNAHLPGWTILLVLHWQQHRACGPGLHLWVPHRPPPPPSGKNDTIWVAYAGATPAQSDTFAFYPLYPAEALGGLQPLSLASRATGQLSTAAYTGRWASTSRPLDVFVAAIYALAGNATSLPNAFTPEDIVTGLEAWLARAFGANQLGKAPGGGVENAGVGRAVTELLLGSAVLVPALSPAGVPLGAAWYARLFPVWPRTRGDAAFKGLVAKGGCVYDAALVGGEVAGLVQVKQVEGRGVVANCTLLSPWPGKEAGVRADCGAGPTAVLWISVSEGAALSVLVEAGKVCNISLTV